MALNKFEYSRSRVDRIGKAIGGDLPDEDQRILNAWRSSHLFPMNVVRIRLASIAKYMDDGAVVVQRLKRLESIKAKLLRPDFPNMKLTQMQDIAGCRAIMPNIFEVRRLVAYYVNMGVPVEKDYLESPKENGYRSVHLVFKYAPTNLLKYNHAISGKDVRRVEIQIRSLFQHYWATAVETAATFLKRPLKGTLSAQSSWERFFALSSSLLAKFENCPPVPGTPAEPSDLRSELGGWMSSLRVKTTFQKWSHAIGSTEDMVPNATMFLISLNLQKDTSLISAFTIDKAEDAAREYFAIEAQYKDNPDIQTVLVSASSIEELRKAYPNYYMDSIMFLQLLDALMEIG